MQLYTIIWNDDTETDISCDGYTINIILSRIEHLIKGIEYA